MIQNLCFSTLAFVLLGGIVSAAEKAEPSSSAAAEKSTGEKYLLRYKFQLGEVLRYRVKHSATISSTIEGTSQQAESTSQSVKALKVTDVLPNGEMEFVYLVEVVRMSNCVPNRALTSYDSELDETPPPGFEQAARAVGVPFSVAIASGTYTTRFPCPMTFIVVTKSSRMVSGGRAETVPGE